jgi:hypothetical protein
MNKFQLCMENVKTLMGEEVDAGNNATAWRDAIEQGLRKYYKFAVFKGEETLVYFRFRTPDGERIDFKASGDEDIARQLEQLTQGALSFDELVDAVRKSKEDMSKVKHRLGIHMGGTEEQGDDLRRAMKRRGDGPYDRSYGRRRTT